MVTGNTLPCGLLLQPGDTGHVEHDSKEEQRLIAKLVQLLLEGFLQLHPALGRGLGLSLEPQPEEMGLEASLGRRREGQCGAQGRGMAMEERNEVWRWHEEGAKKKLVMKAQWSER